MSQQSYGLCHRVNAPDVVAEDFQGQTVILNLANGYYFTLEGCANQIWELLAAGCPPAAILAAVDPQVREASAEFITRLVDNGLISVDAAAQPVAVPPGTSWPDAAPRLEAYTELAELIASDPIHDVEAQIGWPKLAKAE